MDVTQAPQPGTVPQEHGHHHHHHEPQKGYGGLSGTPMTAGGYMTHPDILKDEPKDTTTAAATANPDEAGATAEHPHHAHHTHYGGIKNAPITAAGFETHPETFK